MELDTKPPASFALGSTQQSARRNPAHPQVGLADLSVRDQLKALQPGLPFIANGLGPGVTSDGLKSGAAQSHGVVGLGASRSGAVQLSQGKDSLEEDSTERSRQLTTSFENLKGDCNAGCSRFLSLASQMSAVEPEASALQAMAMAAVSALLGQLGRVVTEFLMTANGHALWGRVVARGVSAGQDALTSGLQEALRQGGEMSPAEQTRLIIEITEQQRLALRSGLDQSCDEVFASVHDGSLSSEDLQGVVAGNAAASETFADVVYRELAVRWTNILADGAFEPRTSFGRGPEIDWSGEHDGVLRVRIVGQGRPQEIASARVTGVSDRLRDTLGDKPLSYWASSDQQRGMHVVYESADDGRSVVLSDEQASRYRQLGQGQQYTGGHPVVLTVVQMPGGTRLVHRQNDVASWYLQQGMTLDEFVAAANALQLPGEVSA